MEWCVDHARLPAREYWDNQWIQTLHRPRALVGTEPYATMLKAKPDELIRMFRPARTETDDQPHRPVALTHTA